MTKDNIAVVGAGLVGSLEACMLAQRGFTVDLFEHRDDIRTLEHVPGKSINLAMSIRGRTALAAIGVEQKIVEKHGIPMRARMIHRLDGSTRPIPYDKDGKCIYSVGRRFVNEVLLTRADEIPNLNIHFNHKLTDIDFDEKKMTFLKNGTDVIKTADLIVGCDGAYSAVRKQMLKRPHFNYNQEYIPHGYMELCIPPASNGGFAMPPNYLHIWPRGQYMMIALPNQDKSWTVTLFMPFHIFESLSSPERLLQFFKENYNDAIQLIGKDKLIKDFFAGKPLPMISVKCSPHHVDSSAIVMGDAAHAMVPFYGQGMNCGMEDCVVFDELLELYDENIPKALEAYSEKRPKDAKAIVDLAMYNYVEMRDLVNSKVFLLRKFWDNFVYSLFPKSWIPLYTMVTFTRTPYHKCIENRKWQDHWIRKNLKMLGIISAASVGTAVVIKKQNIFELIENYSKLLLN